MKFYIDEIEGPEEALPFPEKIDNRWDSFTVKELAAYFHDECGGWEWRGWPYTFVILDDDDKEVVRYSVEREVEPVFYVAEIRKP